MKSRVGRSLFMDVQNEEAEVLETPVEEASPEAPPFKAGSTGMAFPLFLAATGLAVGALAAAWKFGPPNAATETLTQLGLTALQTGCAGVGLLFTGLVLYVSARKNRQIAQLARELEVTSTAAAAAASAPTEQPSEANLVLERLDPMMQTLTATMTEVRELLDQVSAALGGVEQKITSESQSKLTLASSVDNLGAKMEKLQKDLRMPPAKGPLSADDLAPITRLLDSLGRDNHARAARQLEAVEGVLDAMASMEKRLRDQVEGVKFVDTSDRVIAEVVGAVSKLPERICEPLRAHVTESVASVSAKVSQSTDAVSGKLQQSIDGVARRLEGALAAQRTELASLLSEARAAAPTASSAVGGDPGSVGAALPTAIPSPEDSQFGEGPRETKTVLRAIDKLRSLRGN